MKSSQRPLSPEQRELLHLLIIGETISGIAKALHLSRRCVDTRVARIKIDLGAGSRFSLGVCVVKAGLVDPEQLITVAIGRRSGEDWVRPTSRQRDILRLSVEGARFAEAAQELGISARTVRRDLSQLARANGARNDVAAGAVFAALGFC